MKKFLYIKRQNAKLTLSALLTGLYLFQCGMVFVNAIRHFCIKESPFYTNNQLITSIGLITNPRISQYEYIHLNICGSQAENPFPKSRHSFNKKSFKF